MTTITLYRTREHHYHTTSFERKSFTSKQPIKATVIDQRFCYVNSGKRSSTVDRSKDVILYHIIDRHTGYVLGAHTRALCKQFPKLYDQFNFTHQGGGLFVSDDKRFTIQSHYCYSFTPDQDEVPE